MICLGVIAIEGNSALKIKCQEKFAILVLIATSKKVVEQQYFEFYIC